MEDGHPEIVEQVVRVENNAKVLDMATRALLSWAEATGLTADDLAVIQPSYGCDSDIDGCHVRQCD